MRGFENIGSKGHFSAKKGVFWVKNPLGGKREFFSKIRLEHFFSIIKIQLCAKNHQNLMRGFLDMASRTHARTHERDSFSSHRLLPRDQQARNAVVSWVKMAQNWSKMALARQKQPQISEIKA